jgi:hypothetical protein
MIGTMWKALWTAWLWCWDRLDPAGVIVRILDQTDHPFW